MVTLLCLLYLHKYETVTEEVLVAEASTTIERVPRGYETMTERVETAPATTKWEKRKQTKTVYRLILMIVWYGV